jgi:hypothetical protein
MEAAVITVRKRSIGFCSSFTCISFNMEIPCSSPFLLSAQL